MSELEQLGTALGSIAQLNRRIAWLENTPGATIEHYRGRWHLFAEGRSFEHVTFRDVLDAAYDALMLEPQRRDVSKSEGRK